MHRQGLTERAGLAPRHAAMPAQRAINGSVRVGPAFAFGAGPGLPAEQHLSVGFPLVSEEPAMVSAMRRQGLPEPAHGGFEPAAQRPAHNAPPGPFDDQPQPHFTLFMAHGTPQLTAFERFPPLALGFRQAPRQRQRRREREGGGEGGVAFLFVWQTSFGPRP